MGVGPEMGDEVKDRAISISPSPTLSFRDSIWHHHQDPSVALNSICIYVYMYVRAGVFVSCNKAM